MTPLLDPDLPCLNHFSFLFSHAVSLKTDHILGLSKMVLKTAFGVFRGINTLAEEVTLSNMVWLPFQYGSVPKGKDAPLGPPFMERICL